MKDSYNSSLAYISMKLKCFQKKSSVLMYGRKTAKG